MSQAYVIQCYCCPISEETSSERLFSDKILLTRMHVKTRQKTLFPPPLPSSLPHLQLRELSRNFQKMHSSERTDLREGPLMAVRVIFQPSIVKDVALTSFPHT